jgi:threonine dehydrogenase-like Zn-dependent dehydrogenase
MHASTLRAPKRARVVEVERPQPRDSEVLVRIEGCGVCASSVPLWEGRPWFSYPLAAGAPGHEGWGTVEAVGDGVVAIATGDRVALLSERSFAEFDVAPAEHCVRIGIGSFPGEPAACAVNIVRRAELRPGQSVAIVGLGFLGSLVSHVSALKGADVVEVGRHSEISGPFERVIECVGTQEALSRASELVGEGGRLVIAGYHPDGLRSVDMRSWSWLGIDVVNAHERDPLKVADAMRGAVSLGLDVEPLLTHRFALDRLDQAFETAKARPDGFVKAWVEP